MKRKQKDSYSFPSVCGKLAKRGYDKGKAPEDIKLLVDLAACFFTGTAAATAATAASGAAGAPGAAAAAGAISLAVVIKAISEKGKILDAVKRVIELLRKDVPSYEGKCERMREAYTLLWAASFFDAFQKKLPKGFQKELALAAEEKACIARPLGFPGKAEGEDPDAEPPLPELVFGVNRVYERLKTLYEAMTQRLRAFLVGLAFSGEKDEGKIRKLDEALKELPEAALNTFQDQYLTLCAKFGEFTAYLNLEKEREYQQLADEQNQALVRLILDSRGETAQSFEALRAVMESLPERQREREVQKITDHIRARYQKAVKRPIVEQKEAEDEEDEEELSYPSIEEAFVPQYYKLLRYSSQETRLEQDSQWKDCETRKDMLAFWGRYLLDPQSVSHLALILGDPGGGKSLLTEIVSAMVSSKAELVVRIPLRRYIAEFSDPDIEDIVCKQIRWDGDAKGRVESFKEIVGDAPERPVTLIFDGYDEVQQATGRAYATFLKKLLDYQRHCREEDRPVRIVVTSRRTLIDKAEIPRGTLVMMLQPFAPEQKARWIGTWNERNHGRLEAAGLSDFRLPENNREIDELSAQPLLLLMLAIYDADFAKKRNALQAAADREGEGFNRMRLYDELIQRFVERELRKGRKGTEKPFEEETPAKREELLEAERDKLGIAALGMFVRGRLWISVPELNADFRRLQARTPRFEEEDELEAGEVFLGSFFFIHDSRSGEQADAKAAGRQKKLQKDASFVFLHKTFYEFLTADYILSGVFRHAIRLAPLKEDDEDLYESNLQDFGQKAFARFYTAMNGAPLCAEPEIAAMIAEWGLQKADVLREKRRAVSREALLAVLDDLIEKHTDFARRGILNPPEPLSLLPDRTLPQRGALYLLNLATLRTLLLNTGWETGAETWGFLARYVQLYAPVLEREPQGDGQRRMNLDPSEELPLRFMALFQVDRAGDRTTIRTLDRREEMANRRPLDARREVFRFLQDSVSDAVYSLHSPRVPEDERLRRLDELTGIDSSLELEQMTAQLRAALRRGEPLRPDQLWDHLDRFRWLLKFGDCRAADALSWLTCFRQLAADSRAAFPMDAPLGSLLAATTDSLLSSYAREDSRKWEPVLLLWVDLLQKELPFDYETADVIIHWLDRSSSMELPGSILYTLAGYFSLGLAEKLPEISYSWLINAREIIRFSLKPRMKSVPKSPKWMAGVLLLACGADSNPKVRLFHDLRFTEGYDLSDDRVWAELPCLLRELVRLKDDEEVRNLLDRIPLNDDRLRSPLMLEYIALADTVGATKFLRKVYELSIDPIESTPGVYSPSTRAACALLAHEETARKRDLINSVRKSVLNMSEPWLRYAIIVNPEDTARLLTALYRCSADQAFDQNPIDPQIIEIAYYTLGQIDAIYRQSPQAAISFLRGFGPILRNRIWNEKVDRAIRELPPQARLMGHTQEAAELEELLRDK